MFEWDKYATASETERRVDDELDVATTLNEIAQLLNDGNFEAAYNLLDMAAQISILPARLATLHMEMERYRQVELHWRGHKPQTNQAKEGLEAILAELDLIASQTTDPVLINWFFKKRAEWQKFVPLNTWSNQNPPPKTEMPSRPNFDKFIEELSTSFEVKRIGTGELFPPPIDIRQKAQKKRQNVTADLISEAEEAEERHAWFEAAVHYYDLISERDTKVKVQNYLTKLSECYLKGLDDAILTDKFLWSDIETALSLLFQEKHFAPVAEELMRRWHGYALRLTPNHLNQYYYLLATNYLSCKLGIKDPQIAQSLLCTAFYNVADCDPSQLEDFCKMHLAKEGLLDYPPLMSRVCLRLGEEMWLKKNYRASVKTLETGMRYSGYSTEEEILTRLQKTYLDRLGKHTDTILAQAYKEIFGLLGAAQELNTIAESPVQVVLSNSLEQIVKYHKPLDPESTATLKEDKIAKIVPKLKEVAEEAREKAAKKQPVKLVSPDKRLKRVFINVNPNLPKPESVLYDPFDEGAEAQNYDKLLNHLEEIELLLLRPQWDLKKEYHHLHNIVRLLVTMERRSPEIAGRLLSALRGAISLVEHPPRGQKVNLKRLEYYSDLWNYFNQAG
jgi:hypothetical protein